MAYPFPIARPREVVANEIDEQEQQTHEKQRTDKVVQILRQNREPGEQRVADQRQQHSLAEKHDQPGYGEDRKGDRCRPMNDPVEQRKSKNLPARRRLVQLERALDPVKGRDHQEKSNQPPASKNRDVAVAQAAPGLALRLYE